MQNLNFKHYPSRILLAMLCLLIALYFVVKYTIVYFLQSHEPTEISMVNISIEIAGMSSLLAIVFILINKFVMWKWMLKILGLPDLRGNYEGELVSSYHIDDDHNKPNITKWIKMEISQNLNGFYVDCKFYNHKEDAQYSSLSESISHDIQSKDNGEFVITYHYRNAGNKFHQEHKKYGLNAHEGIAILHFNPKNKTLIGKYFNDAQERPSYGNINLNKIL